MCMQYQRALHCLVICTDYTATLAHRELSKVDQLQYVFQESGSRISRIDQGSVRFHEFDAEMEVRRAYAIASKVQYVTIPACVYHSSLAIRIASLALRIAVLATWSVPLHSKDPFTFAYASDSHSRNSSSESDTISSGT